MSRIGASLSGFELRLLNQLNRVNTAAGLNSLRLATNKRINSPSEDPSAFFQISRLENRLSIVNSAITQVSSASTVASKAQLSLDQIRTQLNTIRTALLTDEDLSLSAGDRATTQTSIDSALDQINTLAGTEVNGRRILDGSTDFNFSGLNSAQITDLTVFTVGGDGQIVPQEKAELVYTGVGREIAVTANIDITGNVGTATIDVNAGDDLTDVADIINAKTETTGVTATADGDTLTLNSENFGGGEKVQVVVNSGTFAFTGGNATGTDYGVSQVLGDGPAFSGKVITAATQGELTYTGAGGVTVAAATFTLTGEQGATTITVTNGEALTDVRDRINQYSHDTGITAVVNGDDIEFTTVDYGTEATIDVDVTSGAFATTGGNGDGTAQGLNAVVEINGQTISGNTAAGTATLVFTDLDSQLDADTDFRLTGNLGFFDFSFSATDTLTDLETAINAQKGVTGVEATVSDTYDLILTSTTVGTSGTVSVEVTDGKFAVAADNNSTITTQQAAESGQVFYVGDGNGLVAEDATFDVLGDVGGPRTIVVTEGQTLNAVATLITAESGITGVKAKVEGNQLVIYSVATGPAAFADIDVTAGTFDITGDGGSGRDYGVDAVTAVSGAAAVTNLTRVDGNRVTFNENGLHFNVDFAAGFTGDFNPVTISDNSTLKFALTTQTFNLTTLGLPGLQTSQLGSLSGILEDLRSGGSLSGLSTNTSQAIRVVDEALSQLSLVEGRVDGFADGAVASSASLLDGFKDTLEDSLDSINGINTTEETLLLAQNNALADNVAASLLILQQQRNGILDIIQAIAGL